MDGHKKCNIGTVLIIHKIVDTISVIPCLTTYFETLDPPAAAAIH
jgi:hypothetical protein